MPALELYAGPVALERIKDHGLKSELFDVIVGASGGPKWFTLFGLDKFLFGEFFAERKKPLYSIGTSAGAWRFSCFAQSDPVAAITRLAEGYSTTVYGKRATATEITDKSVALLNDVLGKHGVNDIVTNPVVKSTIITARCRGLTAYENKPTQLLGLLLAAAANWHRRSHLKHFFQRVIFSTAEQLPFGFDDQLGDSIVSLDQANCQDVLQATGAIPMLLHGVENISGAPTGMYRDGGIIDYHFDLPFASQQQLALYPHFYPWCKPGWFDKKIASRYAQPKHLANVLMLSPSPEFIAKLPYHKIPDRKDFTDIEPAIRIKYWQTVLAEGERLAESFNQLINSEQPERFIKPLVVA